MNQLGEGGDEGATKVSGIGAGACNELRDGRGGEGHGDEDHVTPKKYNAFDYLKGMVLWRFLKTCRYFCLGHLKFVNSFS